MAVKPPPEWVRFRVGSGSANPRWTEPTCSPLTTISHVTHVEMALRVLKDGVIRSGLVFDESKLNRERILVTWLSPNYWAPGFRYGNVRLSFDWQSIVAGKRYYWVESMAYGVEA